jgi:hypothetical protein
MTSPSRIPVDEIREAARLAVEAESRGWRAPSG